MRASHQRNMSWPLLAVCAVALAGCQGADGPAAIPAGNSGGQVRPDTSPVIPISSLDPGTSLGVAFGIWQGVATRDGVELQPVGMREGQLLGDSYALDVTEFFTQFPCTDCLRITGYGLNGNVLELDIRLEHPFPDISVRTDLDVMDPRIIVNSRLEQDLESTSFPKTPGYVPAEGSAPETLSANARMLLNADGYTTHFDRRVNELLGVNWSGNLHPYKDYAEDFDPGPALLPIPNHRFSQGLAPETQQFDLNLPGSGVLEFALVLEANYGESSTKATRKNPTYFLPEFNRKEAYDVTPTFPAGTSISRGFNSILNLGVQVRDWQAPATVDPVYPDQANTGGIKQISTVERVYVEAPTIMGSLVNMTTAVLGTGAETDPFVYNYNLARTRNVPPPVGPNPVLVTVVDSLNGQVLSLNPDIDDLGFTQDARAYQIFFVDVDPVGQFEDLSPAYNKLDIGVDRPLPVYPGGPPGGADIAVFNGAGGSGVYLSDADNDVLEFPIFYGIEDGGLVQVDPAVNGVLPFDDYGGTFPHPAPAAFMPIRHLDAADDGSLILAFADPNFTFDPARLSGLGLTVELANDSQIAFFQHDGAGLVAKPRFVSGAGSAGAPGAPVYGDKALNVAEAASNYANFRSPLGWLSGGPATEGRGDIVTWFLYNTPYTNASQRIFNGDVPLAILDGTTASDWDGLLSWDLGTVDRSAAAATQFMYTLTKGGKLTILDVLAGVNEDRTSDPVLIFAGDVSSPVGTWAVSDMQLLEFDPANPRVANGFTQAGDWIVVLYNNLNVTSPGGKIRIYEYSPGGLSLTLIQELADNAGVEPHFTLSGFEVANLDTDDKNYTFHVTLDDNGLATDGGKILVTILGLL